MAEIVSSAVFQDTVGKILSGLVQKYEGGKKSIAIEDLERLEIAQIKLEAAIETSDKWLITDVSLLRWRNKLKRAAQECDDTLHKCKHRILEEKEVDQEVRNSSFPKRIAHATKSLFSSTFRHNDDKLSKYMVRRFEWFADGASEFLRFIELGGTPHCHMPFGCALARHLLTGKRLQSRINRGNACPLFLQWVPFVTAEHGIEANLIFMQNDGNAPENNFFFNIMLQISESVDIVGITIKCLQLFPPLFRSAVENIRKELMQLPTQDFSWVPYVDSSHHKEHWDNLHSFGTQWFRPNPLCCKQHDLHERDCRSKVNMSGISEASLEPVIEVNLQCQVSPPLYNRQRTSPSKGKISVQEQNPPFLKTGLLFMPHGSSQDLLPEDTSSVAEAINIDKQNFSHTNITLQQLEGIIVPKAIDYFCQNAEASVYQILWKSKHSTAYVQVENVCMEKRSTRRTIGRARKGNPFHRENREVKNRKHLVPHYLDLWAAHAPAQLQGSIAEWVQREKEKQMARPQLCPKS
ncbi:hypothetical protein BDA96_02G104000 [Sorghum bicolor]|uniref:Rx N-terminal domain-containing protein n=1 Tax=Sorghum bicolor TaxID=4558 RepID=A0A921RP19_SORBI|nr:hypothetical protein BDA96_02G104000 [Sorghum bicolor]